MCLIALCVACCPCCCKKRSKQITIAGKMEDIDTTPKTKDLKKNKDGKS
jgi:hypothetical protein